MRTSDHDQSSPAGPGRRRLLAAGAGAAVTALAGVPGCGLLRPDPKPEPSPDPLEPLLAGAVALAARYAAVTARLPGLGPRLTPLRDAHLTHVSALAAMIGRPPPATDPPAATPSAAGAAATVPGALAELRGAEQAAQRAATDACLAAPARRAGLLGAIAAARATHAEVLRAGTPR